MAQEFEIERKKMIDEQLIPRVIKSVAVLEALNTVPRHLFVPENMRQFAYNDYPMPIGHEQTISQPYIVAYMTEQLDLTPGMKVLEIGTGSGYQAAVLAELGCMVFSVEYLECLADEARESIAALGYDNVVVRHGDGHDGWLEEAPFDAIIVTAAPEIVPEQLIGQLKDGGRMIIPVGAVHSVQILKLITKSGGRIIEDDLLPVRFVPMV